MKIRFLTIVTTLTVAFGLAGTAIRQNRHADGPLVKAARTVEVELAKLELRVKRLERFHPVTGPTRPPTRPPTLPPTRPPTDPPQPEPERVSWDVTFQDGTRVAGTGVAEGDELWRAVGPFGLRVVWDDFDGGGAAMDPTPTLILANPFRGTGIVRWLSGSVTIGSWEIDLGERGAMVPKGAIIRSALTLAHWALLGEQEDLPSWIRVRALGEIESRTANWIGPYRYWRNDNTSQVAGGDGVAAYHGGSRDWLAVCAEGRAYRWAEACGAMSRALWMLDRDGEPVNLAETGEYYWDGSSVGLAPTGYRWVADQSGWSSYETTIAQRPPADISHGRRWYGAVFALAADCKAARVMARTCWWEIRNAYSMDERVAPTSNPDAVLFSPLHQILSLIGPGGPQEPPKGGNWGNRREAHAINIVAEYWPYMNQEERELYLPAWIRFCDLKVDRFGRADFSYTGDAASSSGLNPTACMAFQQQLGCVAMRHLGEAPGGNKARRAGNRIASWWTADAPYYAETQGDYRTARLAPNSGSAVPDYALSTHPGTWGLWGSFENVVESAKQSGLGETVLDCVTPQDRDWSSVP